VSKGKLKRNLDTQKNRDFWANVDRAAKEVESWPAWMRNQVLHRRDIGPGGCTCRDCPRDGEPDPHTRCGECCPYRESDDG